MTFLHRWGRAERRHHCACVDEAGGYCDLFVMGVSYCGQKRGLNVVSSVTLPSFLSFLSRPLQHRPRGDHYGLFSWADVHTAYFGSRPCCRNLNLALTIIDKLMGHLPSASKST